MSDLGAPELVFSFFFFRKRTLVTPKRSELCTSTIKMESLMCSNLSSDAPLSK